MTLEHQTRRPAICDCVFEEQFEHNETTGDTGEPSLWFFHYVCPKHLPLVENKKQLNANQLKTKRSQIADHHRKLLDNNRVRHLSQFENHPHRKQKLEAVKQLIVSRDTEELGLKMQAETLAERTHQEKFLDKHEDKSMDLLLIGIHSPYAFIAQAVYDAIRQEELGGG